MPTRRGFVKLLVLLGGGALLPPANALRMLEPEQLSSSGLSPELSPGQASSEGEQYAGFLLLPYGVPVPPSVKYPERGMPSISSIDAEADGPGARAISETFGRAEDLLGEVSFPIYKLSALPEGLRLVGANLIKYETGEVFAASVAFQSYNRQSGDWETTASIWAEPDFPRPFPLWWNEPVEPGGPAVALEKVGFLPMPGIMVATRRGAAAHWIENDVLYTLIAETDSTREEVRALASLLTPSGNARGGQ